MYDGSLLPTIPKKRWATPRSSSRRRFFLPFFCLLCARCLSVRGRRSSRSWFETDCLMAVPACIVFVPHIQTFCTNEYMYMIYDGWCINYTSLYFLYIHLWYYFIGFFLVCISAWNSQNCLFYFLAFFSIRIALWLVGFYTKSSIGRPLFFQNRTKCDRTIMMEIAEVGFCVQYILCNVRKISLYVFHIIINSFESFGAKKKPICSPRSAFIRQADLVLAHTLEHYIDAKSRRRTAHSLYYRHDRRIRFSDVCLMKRTDVF